MNAFMIRRSALKDDTFYIDFNGEYEVSALSMKTKITESEIHHAYETNGGEFDDERNVYYFSKHGAAADAVEMLSSKVKRGNISRIVELTEEEIEYIRKALINEDSNIIFTNNNVREKIFNKLNG